MQTPPSGAAVPGARPEHVSASPTSALLALDPSLCHPAPGNRTPTMELVANYLLPSIASIGQKVPGIVRDHPAKPGAYETLAGALRCFCCGVLKIPFKAVRVGGSISDLALIEFRMADNQVREAMSPLDLADDLLRYQQLSGCTQAELGGKLCLSETTISRALNMSKHLAPDLRPLVDNFTVRPSVATLIASLPTHDQQRELMKRTVEGKMTRDEVSLAVRALKQRAGGQAPESRPTRINLPSAGASIVISGRALDLSGMIDHLTSLLRLAKKAANDGLDVSTFERIIQDKARA